jgi:phosphatidylglycerophosphate synthase
MDRTNLQVLLLADSSDVLLPLCGVSLLERLLRILQRLGFRRVITLTSTPAIIEAELAEPSWARRDLIVDLVPREAGPITAHDLLKAIPPSSAATSCLIVPAATYCDARLLEALCSKNPPAILVDSNPIEVAQPLIEGLTLTTRGKLCGPTMLTRELLSTFPPSPPFFEELKHWIENGKIDIIDAATQDDYIVSMRRHVRLLCFPAPAPPNQSLADRIILDSAQKGILDIPARVHAPVEKWIISHLCKTKITPNQITVFTALVSITVTFQFAFGWLLSGTLLALLVGILDGIDGKQARVKVETTELGEWEHKIDAVLEASWWIAIAIYFRATAQVSNALLLVAALLFSHVIDGIARRSVQRITGRSLDDISRFDRCVRLIGGRRNVYIWILAISLLLGTPAKGFLFFCWLGIATAVVHLLRAFWICRRRTRV